MFYLSFFVSLEIGQDARAPSVVLNNFRGRAVYSSESVKVCQFDSRKKSNVFWRLLTWLHLFL